MPRPRPSLTHSLSISLQVMFTRLLYAKLLHQKFTSTWGRGHTLPPSSSPLHTPHTVGMKLVSGCGHETCVCTCYYVLQVCGMEILASRYGEGEGGGEGGCEGPQWSMFLQSLTEKGYFMVSDNAYTTHCMLYHLCLSVCLSVCF